MLQAAPQTVTQEQIEKPEIVGAYLTTAELNALYSFWEYRVYMNPRFTLRGMWFPRNLAWKLRTFWDDFRAGRRPVLLLECPPQHGKSMAVIDFIAWAIPIKGRRSKLAAAARQGVELADW